MKRIFLICIIVLAAIGEALPQDILVMKNGDEVLARVTEIGLNEIKYKKHSLPDGPEYVCVKSDVFMIKYENGSKDVFGSTAPLASEEAAPAAEGVATFYFIRPKKFSASRPEIIVGTSVPDEVIVKLKNGRWHRMEYTHTGTREFLLGIYALNPDPFIMDVVPGETYYFYCETYEQGLKLMAQMKLIDQAIAETYMSELKEQTERMAK